MKASKAYAEEKSQRQYSNKVERSHKVEDIYISLGKRQKVENKLFENKKNANRDSSRVITFKAGEMVLMNPNQIQPSKKQQATVEKLKEDRLLDILLQDFVFIYLFTFLLFYLFICWLFSFLVLSLSLFYSSFQTNFAKKKKKKKKTNKQTNKQTNKKTYGCVALPASE